VLNFSAVDYILNIVSRPKCRFSLYLNIRGLVKGRGKFFLGDLESRGKVMDFLIGKSGKKNLFNHDFYFCCLIRCSVLLLWNWHWRHVHVGTLGCL